MASYISFNQEEQEQLGVAHHDAFGLYFFLKRKANFKTGEFGTFKNTKFRYIDLCCAMFRPGSASREKADYDETGVKALLADLERLGLVMNRQFDGDRLTLELPLSRKWGKNATATPVPLSAAQVAAVPAAIPATPAAIPAFRDGDQFNHLSDEVFFEILDNCPPPDFGSVASPSVVSSSVMIITDSNDSTDTEGMKTDDDLEQEYEEAIRDEIGDGGAAPIKAGEGYIELTDDSDENSTESRTIILADECDADDDIDAPDFSEWQDMLAQAWSGSLPDNECAEYHAPRGN